MNFQVDAELGGLNLSKITLSKTSIIDPSYNYFTFYRLRIAPNYERKIFKKLIYCVYNISDVF